MNHIRVDGRQINDVVWRVAKAGRALDCTEGNSPHGYLGLFGGATLIPTHGTRLPSQAIALVQGHL
jgi:hypothetical protein